MISKALSFAAVALLFTLSISCSSKKEKAFKAEFLEGCAQTVMMGFGNQKEPEKVLDYCNCAYKEYRAVYPKVSDTEEGAFDLEKEQKMEEAVASNCMGLLE